MRLLAVLFVLLGLAGGALFWSGIGSASRADFAFINRGDNKCLDPNGMSWMQDIRLAYGLWEGLYTLDSLTLQPKLGCAESVEISTDKCVYTFHLRPAAHWSNGDALKASDFVFAWRRMLETPGEYTYLHHYIRGAEQYQEAYDKYCAARLADKSAERPAFESVGEESLDHGRTFRVTLIHPVTFFPGLCAFPPFFPMHEPSMRDFAAIEEKTGRVTYDQKFTRPPNLVTNGPFRMSQWLFKRRVRLEANAYYWDRSNVKSRTIDQIYSDDALASFRLYEQGDVDWIADVDTDVAASLLRKGNRPDLHVFPSFGTYYFEFNCQEKLPGGQINPLHDVRVRQALIMAIDKAAIIRDAGRLNQPLATTYVPPGVFNDYSSPHGLPFDVPRAKLLLADAGYPDGQGFPRLTILFNSESMHADVATMLRRQWLNNLGIDTDLEGVEVKVFGKRLHSQQYAIARASWIGDYDDPSTFTDKYMSTSDGNDARWISHRYDELCAVANLEADPSKRFKLLAEAENILLNEAPILPIYTYVGAYLFHDGVTGIAVNARQMVMFKDAKAKHP